jgi:hypothetical protein
MSKPIEDAQAILTDKGASLMQEDFQEMQSLFTQVEIEQWEDVVRVMEGVALIVNDPSYNGDIEPIE